MSTRDRGVLAPFRSLLGAQALGTVLGLLFWVLVARAVAAPEVGVAAAAITTQTLLGLVVSLGLGTHLVAELPAHPVARQHQLLRRSLLAVAVVGGGAGLLLVLAAGPLGLLGESLAAAVAGPLDATVMDRSWSTVFRLTPRADGRQKRGRLTTRDVGVSTNDVVHTIAYRCLSVFCIMLVAAIADS